jgi:hypothetical protein
MKTSARKLIFIVLAAVLLGSCAGQPAAPPTPDINAILTQSIGTLSASFFLTQTAFVPPVTNTPLPTPTPLSTNTPLALSSPIASATQSFFATSVVYPSVTGTVYTPTPNAGSLAYGCNNLGFIRDVTIESGTQMSPGETAVKTWQVVNNGTCNWLYGFQLVPVSGTRLAEDPVSVRNAPVPPNEWRQLSINFTAPDDPGTYTQYWQLSDGAGHTFGSTLGISIVVKNRATAVPPTNTNVPPTATSTATATATTGP